MIGSSEREREESKNKEIRTEGRGRSSGKWVAGGKKGKRRRLRRVNASTLAWSVVSIVIAAFAFGPVLWTVGLSLKPSKAVFSGSWTFTPTFHNFITVSKSAFVASLVHSGIIDVGAMVLTMLVVLPGAYALVRQRKKRLFRVLIDYNYFVRVLPGLIILIPLFIVFRDLDLLNTYIGMILAYQVIGLPVGMATMFGFFEDIPLEIEEAATIDGAGPIQVFARVALPLVRSGAVATAVLVFIMSWTEFLFALVLTGHHTITAPVEILNFLKYSNVDWGALASASVLLIIPSLLFGLAAGRLVVRGLTNGAVK